MSAAHSVPRKPTVLIIMDGVGINEDIDDNALALAHTSISVVFLRRRWRHLVRLSACLRGKAAIPRWGT